MFDLTSVPHNNNSNKMKLVSFNLSKLIITLPKLGEGGTQDSQVFTINTMIMSRSLMMSLK